MKACVSGLGFGFVFGFLLQKGGVGKYSILMGQLLLEDWTVLKIMMSAVLVGMWGIYGMKWLGWVEMPRKKTALRANVAGGLLFGVGFGLAAYCPGTNLAALGQGSWDALAVIGGLLVGSYLFAESSERVKGVVSGGEGGDERTLPEMLKMKEGVVVAGVSVALVVLFVLLEIYG